MRSRCVLLSQSAASRSALANAHVRYLVAQRLCELGLVGALTEELVALSGLADHRATAQTRFLRWTM